MNLEITFRKPFNISRIFRASSNEPRQDYHWVGDKKEPLPEGLSSEAGPPPDQKPKEQNYRPLSSFTLGEVEEVWKEFENQLIPIQENWVIKNLFCSIPLKRTPDGRPPLIFGRVTTCYPSDGHLENIKDIEMISPSKDGLYSRIHVNTDEISRYGEKTVRSYLHRIPCKFYPDEIAEFNETERLFTDEGLLTQASSEYLDLVEVMEENMDTSPPILIVGSRWLQSIPESIQQYVTSKIQAMLFRGKTVINYHPGWLPNEIPSLNQILGYKYGFTPIVLTEPESPKQTAFITAKLFERRILSGTKKKGDDDEYRWQER